MPLDLDLQELRRRVAQHPADGGAHFDLASGLERCGARSDAVEATYRARALGADAAACRTALARLGAKASPWTHLQADSEHTYSAPVRGPRTGSIIATHSSEGIRDVIVDADGSILGMTPGRIWRLSTTSLKVMKRWAFAGSGRVWPVLTSAERVVAHVSQSAVDAIAQAGGQVGPGATPPIGDRLYATSLETEPRFQEVSTAGPLPLLFGATTRGEVIVGSVIGSGTVILRADLTIERTLTCRLPPGAPVTIDCAAFADVTPGQRRSVYQVDLRDSRTTATPLVGFVDVRCFGPENVVVTTLDSLEAGRRSVHSIDPLGAVKWTCSIHDLPAIGCQVACAPDGGVLVLGEGVGGARLARVTPDGRLAWIHRFAMDPSGGVIVDREGCAYVVGSPLPERDGLIAIAPDGAVAFSVPDIRRVLAIDSLGRLLALRGRELVAIE